MGSPTATPSAGRSGAPPIRIHTHGVLAAVALFSVAACASVPLGEAIALDRSAFLSGELWRLATCHLAHWTADHLVFDLGAFCLLFFLCAERDVPRTLAVVAGATLLVPVVVLLAHPEMTVYRGLSGIDSALFTLLALLLAREGHRERLPIITTVAVTALVGFAAKTAYECVTGDAVFAASDAFVPVPLAHAIGALVGAVGAVGGSVAGREGRDIGVRAAQDSA